MRQMTFINQLSTKQEETLVERQRLGQGECGSGIGLHNLMNVKIDESKLAKKQQIHEETLTIEVQIVSESVEIDEMIQVKIQTKVHHVLGDHLEAAEGVR